MTRNWKARFGELMVVAGLISPLDTIPQIVKVYATLTQHAIGQSLTTSSVYTAIYILWAIYGVVNLQLAIVAGNALGAIVY